ncbi:hypothetical protein FB561_6762 [Kribbella amoyensis]|uniref:Membrane protein ArfC n=2 Tax=Kribbella amoyensis TaxID=996641 RepID=A0A561B8P0_9ACTN|nr:hypothetical protein FB561_6762 [Kribbella amoyensis]
MGGLLRQNWPWELLAFLLGAAITWFLLNRRPHPTPTAPVAQEAAEEKVLVGAGIAAGSAPAARPEATAPAREEPAREEVVRPVFSRRMEVPVTPEPTLFDDPAELLEDVPPDIPAEAPTADEVPPGKYGPGSADAVPHQGPPDGFTIKGNAGSMLFHTPDSPYYGRTKPEVWFRTEADAERAGFTKYVRKPRKSPPRRD